MALNIWRLFNKYLLNFTLVPNYPKKHKLEQPEVLSRRRLCKEMALLGLCGGCGKTAVDWMNRGMNEDLLEFTLLSAS